MPKPDLILLHAPSVYDFRERPALYGPISDVIPSTPVFEMYPLGFVSMVGYLEQHGYRVRIVNLAVKMLRNPRLDVEGLIAKLDAEAFGLDLHWLAHAAGSLDVAEIVKKHHPDKPVLLGGLSASYFHDEIIQHFPQIDYILRGDTTEKPLLRLMECIEKGEEPEDVENLTWKDRDGRKRVNPLSFVPEDIDDLWIDYGEVVKLVVRHRDLESTLPYEDFVEYPFTALITCKGCTYNCVTCGGSDYAFRRFFNRNRPVFKTPERLVEEMTVVSEYFKAPIFLIGDLRQGGLDYAEEVLSYIKKERINNTITLELFDAVNESYLRKIAESCESFTMEISPESHADEVRWLMGKPYTTTEMEKTIERALHHGCEKFDIFFMVGLQNQNVDSALKSVDYSKRLYNKLGNDKRIYTFIAPMAPFLDPGSIIFENAQEHGYSMFYKTLREHKKALYQPSWKLYLNYETNWMTRDQIVETTYEAMIRMNLVKSKVNLIASEQVEKINYGLILAREMMRKIDDILESTTEPNRRKAAIENLKREIKIAMESTVYSKKELRVPGVARIKLRGAIKFLLKNKNSD